jgi:hypothetical protein|uniref:Uncharacterized protein n=1 Tax=viral metagenome TaxID=1070528 RepID=A0A6C0BJ36_9ZZZZ
MSLISEHVIQLLSEKKEKQRELWQGTARLIIDQIKEKLQTNENIVDCHGNCVRVSVQVSCEDDAQLNIVFNWVEQILSDEDPNLNISNIQKRGSTDNGLYTIDFCLKAYNYGI